jgi:hypothetical protein
MAETSGAPQISASVPQDFIIEALGGPEHPAGSLDRFPDSLYHAKSPESHLVRFMYALLGPVGAGRLSKDYLEARLALEELGLELFDLDGFFGDPFAFGRLLEESYDEDTSSTLDSEARALIAARDAQYRSRALDYFGGVRLGNSPAGMRLVAKAGLGHDVDIIENYKFLFDTHSDDPQGYRYFGQTTSTEEMIVLPRQEISRSEQQTITISGSPTDGEFTLGFNGRGTPDMPYGPAPDDANFQPLEFDAPALTVYDLTDPANPVPVKLGVQECLEAHPDIGSGNVRVTGGPGPDTPWVVTFMGNLAGRDVPTISIVGQSWTGGDPDTTISVTTTRGGLDASEEVVEVGPREQYHLQQALDRIKAVTTIPTVAPAAGTRTAQPTNVSYSSSEFIEVVRFVTGNAAVTWPPVSGTSWVESLAEKEAPRAWGSGRHHYQGFHDVSAVKSYTDVALDDPDYESGVIPLEHTSEHVGLFSPAQKVLYPPLQTTDSDLRYTADRATADYPEQPLITGTDGSGLPLIMGIYPVSYARLPGVPQVRYRDEQFWASRERPEGSDYIEIDLGSVVAVNFLAFETLRKPLDIDIAYDFLDQTPRRKFLPVTPDTALAYPDHVGFAREAGWTYLEFHFGDVTGAPIYTRYLRLGLSRRLDTNEPFLYDVARGIQEPWSVEVRNLRVGRNVT